MCVPLPATLSLHRRHGLHRLFLSPGSDAVLSLTSTGLTCVCSALQVLYELVTNGFKFSRGAVRVSAAATGPARVTVTVADDGIGIPRHELPLIWGPFHQVLSDEDRGAARRSDGLGLGLYLVGGHSPLLGALPHVHGAVGAFLMSAPICHCRVPPSLFPGICITLEDPASIAAHGASRLC